MWTATQYFNGLADKSLVNASERERERERERESIHADNMAADGIGDIATAVNSILF